MGTRIITSSIAAVAICSASVHAQFITGITKPVFGENQPEAFFLEDGVNTLLFDIEADLGIPATAPGFGGLAGDDANRRFFASVRNGPNDDIYVVSYDDLLNPIKLVETQSAGGTDVSIDGLAYDPAADVLYGTRTLASAGEAEGLFTIDLDTGVVSLVLDYADGGSLLTIGGIDFNPDDGLIYLADDDATGGRFLYAFDPGDPGSGLVEVAALPPAVTDVDGLAVGGGVVLLLTDNADANGGEHYLYDLATGAFSTQPSPYPAPAGSPIAPNPTGGAGYVPGLLGDACPADFDGDGELTLFDFLAFQNAFDLGEASADFDGDGELTLFDFLAFQNAFAAGCP
ncbi:MAG: GC-type dockerin domain-anchored protein [Planctomycetota bacterium]